MTRRGKGIAVLAVQMVLVVSIAGKYAWERHTCPRVWTRASQYDPEQPLRGRYMALSLHASACGLPPGKESDEFGRIAGEWRNVPAQRWTVTPAAQDGKLVPLVANKQKPGETQELTLRPGLPCEYALLSGQTEFFIAEHATTPFPLSPGQELWAEVTVPRSGPPRPVQLAIADGKEFHVLDLK